MSTGTRGALNSDLEAHLRADWKVVHGLWANIREVGIIGPAGSQGPLGNQGAQGDPGPQGLQGPQGNQGAQGVVGAQGTQGDVGPQGAQGHQGTVGNQGATGSTGPQGNQGTQGATGSQGSQGNQGNTGSQGGTGATGAQGPQGSQGETGGAGAQGPTGNTGSQGTSGPQGLQGTQGPNGNQGAGGAQGSMGSQGPPGSAGAQGDPSSVPGPQGYQGTQGPTGSQGNQGNQGTVGNQGASGPQGLQGAQGLTGSTGSQGNQGTVGSQGATGSTGAQGATGSQGATGNQGLTGSQGAVGSQGVTGSQGASGAQGLAGPRGLAEGYWQDATVYYANPPGSPHGDSVKYPVTPGYPNAIYYCKLDHTSSAASCPGYGENWTTYWTYMWMAPIPYFYNAAMGFQINSTGIVDVNREATFTKVTVNGAMAWIQANDAVALNIKDTGAAADGKIWRFTCAGTVGGIDLVNDAYGAATAAIQITRSGMTVTHIDLFGTEVHVAGKFGCNTKAPQGAYASGGAVDAGTVDNTYDASEKNVIISLRTIVNNLRNALIANGICS